MKPVGTAVGGNLPFRTFTNEQAAFQHLEKYHGINPKLASERLHDIKRAAGRGPADNVAIDRTGNVFNPKSGEWLGSLTQGGAKPIR